MERLLSKIPTKSYDSNTMLQIRMQGKWISQYEGLESRKKLEVKMKNVDWTAYLIWSGICHRESSNLRTLHGRHGWRPTPQTPQRYAPGLRVQNPQQIDYTRHVVTVEVHPVPYNKPRKQKVAKKPTSSYDYTRTEQFVCIYSDPKDQPSKGKIRPVNDMYVNNETAQEFTGEEDMGLRKVKSTNQTISQHLQTSADCRDLAIEEFNVDSKERPSDEKMTESPTVNADYTV